MLSSIQFLRFVAALMVTLYHTVDAMARHGTEIPRWIGEMSWVGAAGVPVFFAISGVVMYHTSQGEFARSGASSAFFLRRILRIYPIYWICAGLYLLFPLDHMASSVGSSARLGAALLLVPGYAAAIIPPGWTLPYELYFYVVFAALLFLPKRGALLSLTLLFIASVLLGAVLPDLGAFFDLVTSPQLLIFVSGVWIAHALGPQTRPRSRPPGLSASTLLLISLAGFIVAPVINRYGPPVVVTLGFPSVLLVAACVVAETRGTVPRAVSSLAWLGESSYALYLIHALVLWHGVRWFGPPPADSTIPFLQFVLLTFLCVAASILLHVVVERPLMRWIKKRVLAGRRSRRSLPEENGVPQRPAR